MQRPPQDVTDAACRRPDQDRSIVGEEFALTAGSARLPERPGAEGIARIGRVVGTLLCLAGVVILAVALRSGLYEYFHGETGEEVRSKPEQPK